jgi:pimeloyl-ACP methyl ester carboxylesterase
MKRSAATTWQAAPSLEPARLPSEPWTARAFTQIGGALDGLVLGAMRLAVDAVVMPAPAEIPELRASAERFLRDDLQRDPARFFSFDDAPPRPRAVRDRLRRRLSGGMVLGRSIDTDYRPYEQALGAAEPHPKEGRLLLEHWVHDRGRSRPTVLAVHGFSMGQPRIDAVALFASQWFAAGLDVALLTLPYHGRRTPPGAKFSGEAFAAPHVARFSEAVRRSIYEMRLLVDWLRERNGGPVGLLGLSLGGYLSSLMAGLYDDLDFVIPMVPPVCIGDLAWRFMEQSRRHRAEGAPPISLDEMRAAYRVHSPLTYPLRLAKERVLIIAGRGDRIVPAEHPYALWRHWGEPSIHWFSGSHLAPFGRRRIFAAVKRHLRGLGIIEPRDGAIGRASIATTASRS